MDRISCIKQPVVSELDEFKRLFDASLSSSNETLARVIAHIRHCNGKMMRPILLLLTARLFGTVSQATLHAAVSLELLHTASLVHDDVVDESAERRGQLSVNAAFNNKVAVLSGDYLLATALVHAGLTMNHDIIRVISLLGQTLADGELLQLSNISSRNYSDEIYFDVIKKKTAALFAACTQAAALSIEAGSEAVAFARQLGEYIGICFQIKDDIFDYYDQGEIGKPTGNDMHEGKLTLPALYVLHRAEPGWWHETAARVKSGAATTEEIKRLIAFVKERGGIEYAVGVMDTYRQKAMSLLDTLPESAVRAALKQYVDYVVDRDK